MKLPEPDRVGTMTLEQAFMARHSHRKFSGAAITLRQLSQILWSGNGLNAFGRSHAPSAGALYPINVYVVTFNVTGIGDNDGWQYDNKTHTLRKMRLKEDVGCPCFGILEATNDNQAIWNSAATILITGVVQRSAKKYVRRGQRYTFMEAGHIAQNIVLQVAALGLGAVTIGYGATGKIRKAMQLPEDETPLYLIPVGVMGTPGGPA